MDRDFSFELHGVGVKIFGDKPNLLASLKRDFLAFPPSKSEPKIIIKIVDEIPWSAAGQRKLFPVWRGVRGWWNRRVNIYSSVRAESVTFKGTRYLWIDGNDENALREVIYKFVLSALGEELELQGYHRVHGCGFEFRGERSLVFGKSGVGKSSLAVQIAERSWGLYSDESPLVKGGFLFGFPTRISLDVRSAARLKISGSELLRRENLIDKVLVPFPHPAPAGGLLGRIYLVKTGSESSVSFVSWFGLFGFIFSSVLGLGLAQMAEWMLRISAVPRLSLILIRRIFTFSRLAVSCEFRRAIFSFDPIQNLACLQAHLRTENDQSIPKALNFSK